MTDRRTEASRIATRSARAATRAPRSADRCGERRGSLFCVDGWVAGVAWIEAWAQRGDWIVLDRGAHADVRRGLAPEVGQLLWFEPRDVDAVWAMLVELRSRSDTREILVVRELAEAAALHSPAIAALRALCRDHRATLLAVIELP